MKNYGVLLSGGVGSRISSDIPKQYIRIGKRMMVTYALDVLFGSSYIDEVCIVAEEMWRDEIESDIAPGKSCIFANPGENRQLSILSAMEKIKEQRGDILGEKFDNDTILIHDAARPFLMDKLLEACYNALPGHDGVMPVLPMKDTVYQSEDGNRVTGLLDRSQIYAGQAPELFLFEKYYQANIELLKDNRIMAINGASEPAILAGMDVVMISGDEKNIKVTTDADMERLVQVIQ